MFDPRDEHYAAAPSKVARLTGMRLVIPWPTLYETLRTRMVRNTGALARFEVLLKRPHVMFLDDSPFRQAALELAVESSIRRKRPISMVDCLLRLLLEDVNTRIDYLATFNLRDFADVCRTKGVEII
jgi:hypothetical protein